MFWTARDEEHILVTTTTTLHKLNLGFCAWNKLQLLRLNQNLVDVGGLVHG